MLQIMINQVKDLIILLYGIYVVGHFDMKKNILFLLLCVFCLTSCGALRQSIPSEDQYNLEWVGRTYSQVVAYYGAPDRVESDGNNGNILVYENVQLNSTTDSVTQNITTSTIKKYKQFFVDEEGICYRVKTNMPYETEQTKRRNKIRSNILKGGFFVGFGATLMSAVL